MVDSNSSFCYLPDSSTIAIATINAIFCALGIVGDSLVLIAVYRTMELRTSSNLLFGCSGYCRFSHQCHSTASLDCHGSSTKPRKVRKNIGNRFSSCSKLFRSCIFFDFTIHYNRTSASSLKTNSV